MKFEIDTDGTPIRRTHQDDVVDDIAFHRYGTHAGTAEWVLDNNQGLAAQPLFLPPGLVIKLPDMPGAEVEPITTRRLWE